MSGWGALNLRKQGIVTSLMIDRNNKDKQSKEQIQEEESMYGDIDRVGGFCGNWGPLCSEEEDDDDEEKNEENDDNQNNDKQLNKEKDKNKKSKRWALDLSINSSDNNISIQQSDTIEIPSGPDVGEELVDESIKEQMIQKSELERKLREEKLSNDMKMIEYKIKKEN
ncbi:MAG: hypothetical protein EZS28_054389 [Streblomastix strix]|uniref:Uncharacterized protein n=1 Tax=Streblomastix strix TaxID=222440 RepID=A0A5J4QNX3_9EUKA|nr:MAG: hypothetical protein EZS28_054389 [Streblomastix strix]